MISDLATSTDIGFWASVSLLCAIGIFALVVMRIVGLDRKKIDVLSRLPLEDEGERSAASADEGRAR